MKLKTLLLQLKTLLAEGSAQPNDHVVYYPPFYRPVRRITIVTDRQSAGQRIRKEPQTRRVVLQ